MVSSDSRIPFATSNASMLVGASREKQLGGRHSDSAEQGSCVYGEWKDAWLQLNDTPNLAVSGGGDVVFQCACMI